MSNEDRELAIRFAESLQAASGTPLYDKTQDSALKDSYSDSYVEFMRSSVEELSQQDEIETKRHIQENWNDRAASWSRYETPEMYSIIEGLTNNLNEATRMRRLVPARWPVVSTIDSGRVNAITVRVPTTMECVIFLDRHLLAFANLFSKAIARSMPIKHTPEGLEAFSHDPSDVISHIKSDMSTVIRLTEMLIAYVVEGSPLHAPQYFCAPSHQTIASWFRDSMELFVLGHEYAHVMLGHMAEAESKPGLIAVDTEAEILEYSRSEEMSADVLGMELGMLATLSKHQLDPALCYSGTELFFCAMELVERTKFILLTGQDAEPDTRSNSTHPTPRMRRLVTQGILTDILHEEQAASALKLAEGLDLVAHVLWFFARDLIAKIRDGGARPHPKFLLD